MAVTAVADALTDAGLSPAQLKGKRVAIILVNSMGGEKTDLYAERVNVPKMISSLEKALSLPASMTRPARRWWMNSVQIISNDFRKLRKIRCLESCPT